MQGHVDVGAAAAHRVAHGELLLLVGLEAGGQAAGEHHREQLHDGEDGARAREDHEDGRHVGVQPLLHDEQAAVDVDLLHDHADVGDLEEVLAAARGLEQAARVGDWLLGVSHECVLPVRVALAVI